MIPKFRFFGKVADGQMRMVTARCIDFENGFIYYSYRSHTVEGDEYADGDVIGLEDCVLMQSTGLFDKNGNEIFENDIVKVDGRKVEVVKFGQIAHKEDFGRFAIYQGFSLMLGCGYPEAVMNELEVIGNIYELESVEI